MDEIKEKSASQDQDESQRLSTSKDHSSPIKTKESIEEKSLEEIKTEPNASPKPTSEKQKVAS